MNICEHRKGPKLLSPLCERAAAPALREAGREAYFGQSGGSPAALTNTFDVTSVSPTEGFRYVESVRSSQRKRCLRPLTVWLCVLIDLLPWGANQRQCPRHQQHQQDGEEDEDLR